MQAVDTDHMGKKDGEDVKEAGQENLGMTGATPAKTHPIAGSYSGLKVPQPPAKAF